MKTNSHICPVWVGYLMTSPLRKIQQNPKKIVNWYIEPGMKILEIGPAMGFFSIPMAKMVGKKGRVHCVDIQQKMLDKLDRRAKKYKVRDRIVLQLSTENSLHLDDIKGEIDFCLLAYVLHEIPDQSRIFVQLRELLKTGAKILFIEPKMHVKETAWKESLRIAEQNGFHPMSKVKVPGSRAIELVRN